MATPSREKLEVLHLMMIFLQETDENHTLTRVQLEEQMALYGHDVKESKIYNGIATLREFGMDIKMFRKHNIWYYYLSNHPFSVEQTKAIIDSLQAARFVTENQFNEIKKVLSALACRHNAPKFNRKLFIAENKTYNEETLKIADIIYDAIEQNRTVIFEYCKWDIDKHLVPRRKDLYELSPMALAIDDGKYYMIAFNPHYGKESNYRIDKIRDIGISEEHLRDGIEHFKVLEATGEVVKQIRMYSGKEEHIRLKVANELCNVFFDEFGLQIPVHKNGDGTFTTTIKVQMSDQFLGFLFGLGTDVEILGPAHIRDEYCEGLKRRIEVYGNAIKRS